MMSYFNNRLAQLTKYKRTYLIRYSERQCSDRHVLRQLYKHSYVQSKTNSLLSLKASFKAFFF